MNLDHEWSDEQESERGVYPLTPRHEGLGYALYLDRIKNAPLRYTHVNRCWCDRWKPWSAFMCFGCRPEGRKTWETL